MPTPCPITLNPQHTTYHANTMPYNPEPPATNVVPMILSQVAAKAAATARREAKAKVHNHSTG